MYWMYVYIYIYAQNYDPHKLEYNPYDCPRLPLAFISADRANEPGNSTPLTLQKQWSQNHWIGLREHLQETMFFYHSIWGFPVNFP